MASFIDRVTSAHQNTSTEQTKNGGSTDELVKEKETKSGTTSEDATDQPLVRIIATSSASSTPPPEPTQSGMPDIGNGHQMQREENAIRKRDDLELQTYSQQNNMDVKYLSKDSPSGLAAAAYSHLRHDWRHLPADMIFTIASSLDGRSLARLERTDKFTHSAIAKRGTVLWRALTEKSEKTGWLTAIERDKLKKLQESETMTQMKENDPKQYCIIRAKTIQEFHHRLREAQQARLHSAPFKKRSLALRWYGEVVLPISLFILFTLFVIFLIYQLQTNDGSVTWMTMSPLIIFCGLITFSTCVLCFIRCRGHVNPYDVERNNIVVPEYDTEHFIANNYAQESNSFISAFMNMIVPFPIPTASRRRPYMPMDRLVSRFLLASLIMLGLLICVIFVALRVTGTVDWSWTNVFTPFFVGMGLICCIGGFPGLPGAAEFLAAGLVTLFSPLITFIILLSIYLNNGGSTTALRLQYVFIPLYIVDGITFVYSWVPTIALLIGYCFCRDDVDDDANFPLINFLAALGWLLFIGPFLYMKIVLGLRADGGDEIMSNLALFLPLLLPLLLFICGCVYVMLDNGVFRALIDRSDTIEDESRLAANERVVPPTVEEIENDEHFVLTIVEPTPAQAGEAIVEFDDSVVA